MQVICGFNPQKQEKYMSHNALMNTKTTHKSTLLYLQTVSLTQYIIKPIIYTVICLFWQSAITVVSYNLHMISLYCQEQGNRFQFGIEPEVQSVDIYRMYMNKQDRLLGCYKYTIYKWINNLQYITVPLMC